MTIGTMVVCVSSKGWTKLSKELNDAFDELAVTIGQLRRQAERWLNATGDWTLVNICNELSRISWRLYRICM